MTMMLDGCGERVVLSGASGRRDYEQEQVRVVFELWRRAVLGLCSV